MRRVGWVVFIAAAVAAAAASTACSSGETPDDPPADAGMTNRDGAIDDHDGGGGNNGDAEPTDGEAPPGPAPQFAGLVAVLAESTISVNLSWMDAKDDVTPASRLLYDIYRGPDAASADAAAENNQPPLQTVTGQTFYIDATLSPATDYAYVVVARDSDGNRSARRPARSIKTLAVPMVLKKNVINLASLGFTVTPIELDLFEVTGADISQINAGDLVIAENPFGRSLRKITQVTPTAGGAMITAIKAELSEAIQSGELRISGELPDPTPYSGDTLRGAYYRDRDGKFSISQNRQRRVSLSPPPRRYESENGVELEENVELDYGFTWEVGYEADVRWFDEQLGLPESMNMIFSGALGVEGKIAYELSAEAKYEVEKELLSRTMQLIYTVGGLPVVQEVKLQLMAKLELEAEGELKAGVEFSAEKTVRFGFAWYNGQGFFPIKDDGFEQETEITLEGEASAKATLKIYPVVSTRFYGIATGKVAVDPSVEMELHARFLPLPVELDKANIDFSVGVQLSADLSIFGKELAKWESDRFELYKVPVLSQPELKLLPVRSANICHPAKVSLLVSHGYNNPVPAANIYWEVIDGPGTINPEMSGIRADLESTGTGTVTVRVRAHGNGPLGLLGQRYAELAVNFVDPQEDCDMVPAPAATPISCAPLESGYTGPPYFNKTRAPIADPELRAFAPLHTTGPFYVAASPFEDEGNPRFYRQAAQFKFPFLIENPFDGDWEFDSGVGYERGRYTFSLTMHPAYDNRCSFFPGTREECQALGPTPLSPNYYEIAAALGPTEADRHVCETFSGIPFPWVDIVGPGPDEDGDDDAAHAEEFSHGERSSKNLVPGDKDFVRYRGDPVAAPGIYDTDRPEPGCDVAVTAEGNPPVLITVYEGEEDAGNESGAIVEGLSRVRFTPNPAEVYFARFQYRDAAQSGDYVAELESDCTQETAFPLLADRPSSPVMTAVHGETFDLTIPINGLVERLYVQLRENVEFSSWSASGSVRVDVPAGATEVIVPIEVWNGGFPDGDYFPEIQVGDVENDAWVLLSTYGRNGMISTGNYTLKKENFIAGTSESEDTGWPLVLITLGPP